MINSSLVSLLVSPHQCVLVMLRELSSVNGSHVFACFVDLTTAVDSDWLERLLHGSQPMASGFSAQSPGRRVFMIFLAYCVVSLLNCVMRLSFPRSYTVLLLWHVA